MKNDLKIIAMAAISIFLVGCGGWSLTGKEFTSKVAGQYDHAVVQASGAGHLIEPAQESLSLRGVGVKNIFLMRIFIAGLYLPSDINSDNALNDNVPKDLSVLFYAKFSARDFANFTIDHMKPNLSLVEFQSLKDQLDRMGQLLPDINPGDNLALSYRPGVGTSFIHNGKLRGTIEGDLFSKAIYSTWIGPRPFDNIVKRQILGINTKRS